MGDSGLMQDFSCSTHSGITGVVLVVDDEPIVRNTAKLMLERLGCKVLEAENGQQALETFRTRPVDVVLLDVSMPVLSGEATLRQILEIDPSAHVIISSGYGEQMTQERFQNLGVRNFLQKPYTCSRMREVIQKAVDAPGSTAAMRTAVQ
jgi:CheY-like chemotaxis protein